MAKVYRREGSAVWQASFEVSGKRRRISTQKRDQREAQAEADRLEREALAEAESAQGLRVLKCAELFFRHQKLKESTVAAYKLSLTNLCQHLGDFPIATTSLALVESYVTKRLVAGGGQVAIRRDLAFWSSLFSASGAWEPRIKNVVNPIGLYKAQKTTKTVLREAEERTTWATPKEYQSLMDEAPADRHKLYLQIRVLTGLRPTETQKLRWSQIDWDNRFIRFSETKRGKDELVVIPDTLFDTLLVAYAKRESDWVFYNRKTKTHIKSFRKAWTNMRKNTGLNHLHSHDLRHTFATWAKLQGVGDLTLQKMLRHKTLGQTARYTHVSLESLHEAAQRVTVLTQEP